MDMTRLPPAQGALVTVEHPLIPDVKITIELLAPAIGRRLMRQYQRIMDTEKLRRAKYIEALRESLTAEGLVTPEDDDTLLGPGFMTDESADELEELGRKAVELTIPDDGITGMSAQEISRDLMTLGSVAMSAQVPGAAVRKNSDF